MPSFAGILARSAPSASADWKPLAASTDGARIWTIEGDDAGSRFAAREPIVLRSQESGAPLFSLTLTLERQPAPGEASIVPLIRSGAIGVTLDVLPTAAEIARVAGANAPEPLFPRSVTFAITRGDSGRSMVEATAEGSTGRAGLSGPLAQDDAIAVLRALRGEASGLVATATIAYRASGPAPQPMRVELDLAAVHDFLAAATGADGELLEIDLLNYLAALIDQGRLKVTPMSASAADTARQLLPDFIRACMPILQRTGTAGGSGPAYRLQGSPSPGSMMTFQSGASATGAVGSFTVSRPLEAALAPITRERPLESFLSVVVGSPDGRGFAPISQRQRGEPPATTDPPPMAGLGNTVAAMPAVLRTGRAIPVSAHVLAASDLVVQPERPQRLWLINDLVVDLAGGRQQHYPQIDDGGPIWPDRISPDRWWYAPELMLVQPEATSTAASTPFLFSFTPTGHDEQGRPGLEATIRFRLRPQMPSATQQLWESRGKPAIEPVPLNGLAASLEIPYRNTQGQPGSQVIAATSLVASGEEYEATFELTDQWARLAYGALAIQGFQAQPPNIVVSYVFPAYVPVGERELPVQWGGKRLEAAATVQDRGFNISALAASRIITLHANSAVLNAANAHIATAIFVPQRSYGVRTQGHTDRIEATLPCSTFGMLYVQTPEGGGQPTAIGCQDAFTLGQVQLKLYEQLTISLDGGTPFRVYRSLQVPGRFLVLPNEYTISRFEPGDSRAYRPALFMFSNIDAVNRDRTRCVVMATLQPSVSAYWRARLLDYLRANVHPSPQLEWPTELPVHPVYSWALPSGGPEAGTIDAAVAKTPDGFQVSLATGVDGILQLKAMLEKGGVSGVASFALADGSVLQSALTLDLAKIDGPFVAGPIEATLAAGSAHLVNRIEQPLDIGELVADTGSGLRRVPVEKRFDPAAAVDVAAPAGTSHVEVQATAAGGAASLEEVRTFVEDIYVTPVFQASFDFASQKLASVTVEARIARTPGSTTATLTPSQNRAEVSLILPLTTYLAQPTLQFALTRTPTDGPQVTGAWHDWRLDTLGTVIEINNAFIQQG